VPRESGALGQITAIQSEMRLLGSEISNLFLRLGFERGMDLTVSEFLYSSSYCSSSHNSVDSNVDDVERNTSRTNLTLIASD
jgi:hypothetical protein